MDVIGTVDRAIYAYPYVSARTVPALFHTLYHSCDTQLPVFLLRLEIMVTL
jgi:hypothetical protein